MAEGVVLTERSLIRNSPPIRGASPASGLGWKGRIGGSALVAAAVEVPEVRLPVADPVAYRVTEGPVVVKGVAIGHLLRTGSDPHPFPHPF